MGIRAVVRLGDICTGHNCFPPRPSVTASTNVSINGRGAVRVGDLWAPHTCETTPGTQTGGSSTVFVNGLALENSRFYKLWFFLCYGFYKYFC